MFTRPTKNNHADIRPWVKMAVVEEDANPPDQLWKNEPSAKTILKKQEKRIHFLRKHGKRDPKARDLADRLESCHPGGRCLSGACVQCAQLLQRWFVRQSKRFIARHIETAEGKMIAISIVPTDSTVEFGELRSLSIANYKRRIKYALRKAKIQVAIGGVDFPFNEGEKSKYEPLAPPLPSIASATASAALFGDFRGTMGESDFPWPCIIGLRVRPSRCGPFGTDFPKRPTSGYPGSRFSVEINSGIQPADERLSRQTSEKGPAGASRKNSRHPAVIVIAIRDEGERRHSFVEIWSRR